MDAADLGDIDAAVALNGQGVGLIQPPPDVYHNGIIGADDIVRRDGHVRGRGERRRTGGEELLPEDLQLLGGQDPLLPDQGLDGRKGDGNPLRGSGRRRRSSLLHRGPGRLSRIGRRRFRRRDPASQLRMALEVFFDILRPLVL